MVAARHRHRSVPPVPGRRRAGLRRAVVLRQVVRPARRTLHLLPSKSHGRAPALPAWRGQETVAELDRQASAGQRPRTDYVELARVLDADVLDMRYLTERAAPATRLVARTAGYVPAQVLEAFLRERRYDHIVARADRLGLPLALAFKLAGRRRDLVLVSVWLSRPKKAVFLSRLKVHTHLGAIVNYGTVQRDHAAARLGVPAGKLHVALQPVDERFWRPVDVPAGDYVLSTAREFPETLRDLAETGEATFSMRLEQLERRFPGLANLRISSVDLQPLALMDSSRFSVELTLALVSWG